MTFVKLDIELHHISEIDRIKQFDGNWVFVGTTTNPTSVEQADLVLFKNGMLYNKETGKWTDYWSEGFYPEWPQEPKQTLREFSEKIVVKDKPKAKTTVPFKYNEGDLLKEFNEYVASTYKQHYVGEDNVQSLDLIFAIGMGSDFCKGNGIKYLARSGKKSGQERNDLLKTMHYTLLALYLHDKKAAKDD